FTRDDVPAVAALRRTVFRQSTHASDAALEAYIERVFLPPHTPEGPSLVHQDDRGTIDGFVGVIPQRMVFDDRPVTAHVATQLMVAETSRGLAGAQLLRNFLAGPQDLS